MNMEQRLFQTAKKLARATPHFSKPKGPGDGNRRSAQFAHELREWVKSKSPDFIKPELSFDKRLRYAFDFYIPKERTVVEVALSLHNALTEFEKDISKFYWQGSQVQLSDRISLVRSPFANSSRKHLQSQ